MFIDLRVLVFLSGLENGKSTQRMVPSKSDEI